MARTVSKWAISVGVTLVGLSGAFVGSAAIVHARWNGERAAKTISAWASDTLAGEGGPTKQAMVFERIEYPLWPALRSLFGGAPLRVNVWGFHIYDPDGREVMGASHVETGLRLGKLVWLKLWGLLPGPRDDVELFFVDAKVDEVHTHLALDHEGDVNLVAAFERRKGTESKRDKRAGLIIDVDGSVIDDATFEAAFSGWDAKIEHATIDQRRLRYSSFSEEQRLEAPAFTYQVAKLSAPTGSFVMGALRFPLDHVVVHDLRAEDPKREDIRFVATAHCLGSALEAHGALLDVYSHAPGANIHASAQHGEHVLATLPSKAYLSGDAEATMHLSGTFAAAKLEGAAHGLEGKVLHLQLHKGTGHYRLEDGKLALAQLHAQLAGGTVEADASVTMRSRKFEIQLRPKGLKLADLGRFAIVELASAVAGLGAQTASDGSGELQNHLSVRGIDVTLYRRVRTEAPDRVLVKN